MKHFNMMKCCKIQKMKLLICEKECHNQIMGIFSPKIQILLTRFFMVRHSVSYSATVYCSNLPEKNILHFLNFV